MTKRNLKAVFFFGALFAALSFLAQQGQTQSLPLHACTPAPASEAPSGFDDQTNGFVSPSMFTKALGAFNKHYIDREGLGPVYNLETCLRCHQFPTSGGSGLIFVTRVGRFDGQRFIAPAGGTIIHSVAIPPTLTEKILPEQNVVAKRLSTSLLGDGFVEAIADETLRAIALEQTKISQGRIHGEAIDVPVLEAPETTRLGRFGWKNSHASLLTFTGEALRNELGVTNPLYPEEITSNGKSLAAFDKVPDPEVKLDRLELITNFVRATKAPARNSTLAQTSEARSGEKIFAALGCAICHVQTIKTMPVGTLTNGGKLKINEALGNKIIHPYSDFLLHDIGTGDGIVETIWQSTRNKIRTAPLWGVGTRLARLGNQALFLHDGSARTLDQAITRHQGEAAFVMAAYKKLSAEKQQDLLIFLQSL
ncbi:MAG: hypothetical protein HY231_25515 [Acidobacteria bacterium]|nr:hypothetical protein [Acidobacteriota bacterium]